MADYARLRLLACPGSAFARIDPAHTENNGMSSKGPDSSCVPLCRSHHLEYDSGREAFESKYGIDMKAIAAAYWERYQQERATLTVQRRWYRGDLDEPKSEASRRTRQIGPLA